MCQQDVQTRRKRELGLDISVLTQRRMMVLASPPYAEGDYSRDRAECNRLAGAS